jgi:hypothetical protein
VIRYILALIFVFSPVLGVGLVLSLPARGATALETVIAECRARTKFSETTCLTLVRKNLNVERCKQYTSWDDAECQKKVEEIKADPKFSSGSVSSPPKTNSPAAPRSGESVVPPVRSSEAVKRVRSKKESDLILLWQRTEELTGYLKGQGKDVAAIEAHFPEFEQRAETVLAAYDAYLPVFERSLGEPALRSSVLPAARSEVQRQLFDLLGFYRSKILVPLESLISAL